MAPTRKRQHKKYRGGSTCSMSPGMYGGNEPTMDTMITESDDSSMSMPPTSMSGGGYYPQMYGGKRRKSLTKKRGTNKRGTKKRGTKKISRCRKLKGGTGILATALLPFSILGMQNLFARSVGKTGTSQQKTKKRKGGSFLNVV